KKSVKNVPAKESTAKKIVVKKKVIVKKRKSEIGNREAGSGKSANPLPLTSDPLPPALNPEGALRPVVLPQPTELRGAAKPLPSPPPNWEGGWLTVRGARQHNLKSIDAAIPLGTFTAVTGVSGSGKSSLVEDVLYNTLAHQLHRASLSPGAHERIDGVERINKVIRVDQQPLGQTPTSNPATYTGVFELMRNLFAQLPDAKLRGYTARRFSFNVPGGRCEKCEGNGQLKIEMHFLPNVWITCDACNGKRYDRQTLEVKYRDHSIADILEMSCGQARELFRNIPKIRRILQTICDVGLDYLSLGQAAPTLSGGEAQRVKLAAELSRPDTGRTLYLLDEPTTGLHFDDLQNLLGVVQRLVDLGNTVVMIEHNLDMIKSADWVIDLGPEAGFEGGYLVYAGTPEALVDYGKQRAALPEDVRHTVMRSYTAEELAPILEAGPFVERVPYNPASSGDETTNDHDADVLPEDDDAQMPWEVNGRKWHTQTMISRSGKPCQWDGRILADIVDRIEETDLFAETDWNNRTIVEIRAQQKSLGWFLHAITGEEWLLKLKFRTAKNTFRRDTLAQQLALAPLNDMDDIPQYGTEPRTKVNNAPQGPYQEIELRVHSWQEIDRPEFWAFLDTAIRGFAKFLTKVKSSPEDITPWRVLKEKWHFLPKGYVGGTTPVWSYPLLEEIFAMLRAAASDAEPNWSNKVLVPFSLPGGRRWAVVHTKRVDGITLELHVKKNSIPLGLISGIGHDRTVDGTRDGYDVVTFVFTKKSELKKTELAKVLQLSVENAL
ncbi:MAG: ATP-binding cassette domain-containing protein, partial [Planctomycetaceae bacterium]|nr:ATP-binding cassette domain-containing protein [Planctomycetaceae bacterium]